MIKVTVNKDKVAIELNGKEEVVLAEIVMVMHMCLSAIYAPLARLRAVYSLSWEKICPTAFASLVGHKLSDFRPLS